MSSFPAKRIERALVAKGFVPHTGGDHVYYWLVIDGEKRVISTMISHGRFDYGNDLLAKMARQLKLERRELDDLIRCPLSAERYLELLRERGFLQ